MPRTYTLIASQVLTSARALLADAHPTLPARSSEADLLRALNDALAAMVALVPGLFSVQAQHVCDDGYLQELQAERASMFLDVIGMPEADPATLSQFAPGWQAMATGKPENYMRVPGDPLRFMVYPPASQGEDLQIRFVQLPPTITFASSALPLPEAFAPALAEYIAGRVSLADDEHMNSGRATALNERFAMAVKAMGGT
jgi:hypothetical protein